MVPSRSMTPILRINLLRATGRVPDLLSGDVLRPIISPFLHRNLDMADWRILDPHGTIVFSEKYISPLKFLVGNGDGECDVDKCVKDCKDFGFSQVNPDQPIPTILVGYLGEGTISRMSHLCVNHDSECACSVQPSDNWNQGQAITTYDAEETLPLDTTSDDEELDKDRYENEYKNCVKLCNGLLHKETIPEGFLVMTEIKIHLVVDNVCNCRAHPEFSEERVVIEFDDDLEGESGIETSNFAANEDSESNYNSFAKSFMHGTSFYGDNANVETTMPPAEEGNVEPLQLTDDDQNPDSP